MNKKYYEEIIEEYEWENDNYSLGEEAEKEIKL